MNFKLFHHLFLGLSLSLAPVASAQMLTLGLETDAETQIQAALRQFQNIYIDVRGSRGGKGDVGAGFLTAEDLVRRRGFGGKITFIIDETSRSILEKMLGGSICVGEPSSLSRFQFYTLKSLPKDYPPADLYLSLARPSGREQFASDFSQVIPHQPRNYGTIGIHEGTVRITQTVLGNTENKLSQQPNALVKTDLFQFTIPPAGIAPNESGIYYDSAALSLRDKTKSEVRTFIIKALARWAENLRQNQLPENPARRIVGEVVEGAGLAQSQVALVYGITHPSVKKQFETYLEALAIRAAKTGESFTILTPSGFELSQVENPSILKRLVLLQTSSDPVLPKKASAGKIYIVKTGAVAQDVFNGLLAYSDIPPIVAGDGAMSAAIGMGIVFVMTQVSWNIKNIKNFSKLLSVGLENDLVASEVFAKFEKSDFKMLFDLVKFKQAFHRIFEKIPSLTDLMLRSAWVSFRLTQKHQEFKSGQSVPNRFRLGLSDYVSKRKGAVEELIGLLQEDPRYSLNFLADSPELQKAISGNDELKEFFVQKLLKTKVKKTFGGWQDAYVQDALFVLPALGIPFALQMYSQILDEGKLTRDTAYAMRMGLEEIGTPEAFQQLKRLIPLENYTEAGLRSTCLTHSRSCVSQFS